MKKKIKKLLIVLIIIAIPFIFINMNVYADIDPYTYTPKGQIDSATVTKYGGKLYSALWIIGIAISVIVLMIIGLKFILASASEKAEYKKYLVPVVLGIFIVGSICGIVSILQNVGEDINSSSKMRIVVQKK